MHEVMHLPSMKLFPIFHIPISLNLNVHSLFFKKTFCATYLFVSLIHFPIVKLPSFFQIEIINIKYISFLQKERQFICNQIDYKYLIYYMHIFIIRNLYKRSTRNWKLYGLDLRVNLPEFVISLGYRCSCDVQNKRH